METPQWTLSELAAEVAAQLARNYEAADNGQVRAIPDERAIRYYNTLGLLDRPDATRGRTALYGPRHLAQVVAIKRLQAAGRSLSEIRTLMASIDDPTLSRVAGVVVPPRPRRAFWREEAGGETAVAPASASASVPVPVPVPVSAPVSAPAPAPPPRTWVDLGGVLARVDRPLTPDDLAALARAAAPLLAELTRRGLTTPDEPKASPHPVVDG